MSSLLEAFSDRWEFTRSETLAILHNLSDDQLLYTPPGDTWKPLYWQFTCAGRTQLVYAHAVVIGKMDFSLFKSDSLPAKDAFTTKRAVKEFLEYTEKQWRVAILDKVDDPHAMVSWSGRNMPLVLHMSGLMEHERMHLGQLISYHTMAGYKLPKSFKENWAL